MPQLTVLLPVRNGNSFLRTAIRSTLLAMPRDSELLVHDDGSTDDTLLVAEAFARDRRLRLSHSDQAQGVACSLNRLLAGSDSQVVARMDADDICLPWRFAAQDRSLRRSDSLWFGTVAIVDERGHFRRVTPPMPLSGEAVRVDLLLGNRLLHPTLAAPRSVVENLGGYRDVGAEDYDLWLRAVAAGVSVRRMATPLLLYRVHSQQVTEQAGARSWHRSRSLQDSYAAAAANVLGLEASTKLTAWFSRGAGGPLDPTARRALIAACDRVGLVQRCDILRRLRHVERSF